MSPFTAFTADLAAIVAVGSAMNVEGGGGAR
jgi:hypothetical protein